MVRRGWVTLLFLFATSSAVAADFARADRPRAFEFPRDHASHPAFATEWWYFTGSLLDGEDFAHGFQLTFFRVAMRPDAVPSPSPLRARDLVLGHFTITEVQWERFHHFERVQRAAGGLAGADSTRLHVFLEDWSVEEIAPDLWRLRALEGGFSIDLELRLLSEPVLHGDGGWSVKTTDGEQASYYYSLPRLRTSGTMVLDGHARRVSGVTWMDHEFFTGDTPVEGLGWDWFSLRLADGRDLMLYRVRKEGRADSPFGTLVEADGRARPLHTAGAKIVPGRTWTSPDTRITYPVAWRIELPEEGVTLGFEAVLDAQEVVAEQTVGFPYWEGLSRAKGSIGGVAVEGEGYVELTGYAAGPR